MIKSRRMRWALLITNGGEETAYRPLVGKPELKSPLGRPRRMWNIKINFREINGMVWTGSIWLRIGTSGWLWLTR
jgi:hypothetical protein